MRHVGFSLVVACRFSLVVARAPDSVVCGTWALLLRRMSSVVVARGLCCPAARGILIPRPGIEPTSPALEGRFFTTGPPGKSLPYYSLKSCPTEENFLFIFHYFHCLLLSIMKCVISLEKKKNKHLQASLFSLILLT